MRKVFLLMSILLTLNASEANLQNAKTKVDCDAIMQTNNKELIAQSGCCSWHQGVCGCSNGRAACCDGSLSPSCGCNSIVPVDAAQANGAKL